MEKLTFHPVYLQKKESAQKVNTESQEIKHFLRKRQEEELAEKQAKIKASRLKPRKSFKVRKNDSNNNTLDDLTVVEGINVLPHITFNNEIYNASPMTKCSTDSGVYNKIDLNIASVDLHIDSKDANLNCKQENVAYDYNKNKTDNISDGNFKKEKSKKWVEFRKNVFDKASEVYLESKEARDFIQKRKELELEEKRAKVIARRQTQIAAKEKRKQCNWMTSKNVDDSIKNQVDDTQASTLQLFLKQEQNSESVDLKDNLLILTPENKENIIENKKVDESSYGEEMSDIIDERFSDKASTYSSYDSEYSSEYSTDINEESHTNIKSYTQPSAQENYVRNYENNNENNKFNKIKNEIKNAFIMLQACSRMKDMYSDGLSIETRGKRDLVQTQRQYRRLSVAQLKERRRQIAERVRRDSSYARAAAHASRLSDLSHKRVQAAITKDAEQLKTKKSVIPPKPTRWTIERERLEQEFLNKLLRERRYLQEKITKSN